MTRDGRRSTGEHDTELTIIERSRELSGRIDRGGAIFEDEDEFVVYASGTVCVE